MVKLRTSLFIRLLFHNVLYLLITICLAAGAIGALAAASRNTSQMENVWADGAETLGEIDYNLAAFRASEAAIALAPNDTVRRSVDADAAMHRQTITALTQNYLTLLGRQAPPQIVGFIDLWAHYQTLDADWAQHNIGIAANSLDAPGNLLDSTDRRTDAAIEGLIDIHSAEGHATAARVERIARLGILIVSLGAALSVAFSVWLLRRTWRETIHPLIVITRAMTRLAAGDRESQVPYGKLQNEIGEMAAACEVFRINVLALDKAHEAARIAEDRAQKLARHDALTGLPNRRVFSADLQAALDKTAQGRSACAVLLLDLDEFKRVNDMQGHQAGDFVLCEVAHRLEAELRKTDTVARLGGDEFAVITQSSADPQEHLDHTKRLAARLLGIIRQPILMNDSKIEIGVSIGIASSLSDAHDVNGLLRAADIAMYRAKQSGRFTFRFFEQAMDDEMRDREALESDLTKALAAGQIKPHYQPLVDIDGGRVRGFEALARWQHPQRGYVPPEVFVPIIEQLGLTRELGAAILRQACRDAKLWPEEICVAVNFSPLDLKDQQLPERIAAILAEEGLVPSRLEIEITETALVSDLACAKTILTALQTQGITICLDDFGTGYSSLYHLRELKFNRIKIDRSFIQAMRKNADSEKIIDAILGLTKSLHLPTVAEGIETETTLRLLRDKGCDYGQGFFFGKAIPASETAALLARQLEAVN